MSFRDTLAALKALGDENRLRALLACSEQELCVCQITELLQLAPSTVSKHMSILRQADLVDSRKDGRWIYYRLSTEFAAAPVQALVAELRAQLAADPKWQRDRAALLEILAIDPEELCRRQARAGAGDIAAACEDNECCAPVPAVRAAQR
ncbi:MAG: metalloregulator ArsR/SmtB family transcription factor [Bryobacterales bacterium]|nr:metalloregulator ArsR/SmtB family transcription factor [Bryobacterales bacterium]